VAQVKLAREAGLSGIFFGEHFLTAPVQMAHQQAFLARLSAEAEGMHVGTSVCLLALHNPIAVAAFAATMDAMTDGRFVLGVGLGYRAAEFKAFSVSRAARGRILTEKIRVVDQLLRGQRVTASGQHYALTDAQLAINAGQGRRPPIWVAANNDKGLQRAAEVGDAWLISGQGTLTSIEAQVHDYYAHVRALGESPPSALPVLRECFVASRREEAVQVARRALESKYQLYVEWGQHREMPSDDTLALPYELLTRDRFLIGTPEDCARDICEYLERIPVDFMILRMQWPGLGHRDVMRSIALFAEEVVPRVAAKRSSPPAVHGPRDAAK
jgi:alkanesulfonate monooxygenase SsuD/methylene tetrahydromethanopterin reductase-like flavin-dependent oxidoreductase (luciferase family)